MHTNKTDQATVTHLIVVVISTFTHVISIAFFRSFYRRLATVVCYYQFVALCNSLPLLKPSQTSADMNVCVSVRVFLDC